MAPKADKKPASKAPSTASKAPEKKDAGKKTASSGDKKKRTKSRKETYSSYIYKGESFGASFFEVFSPPQFGSHDISINNGIEQSILTANSSQAGPPRHWYLQPCHVHPELVRQRYVAHIYKSADLTSF